MPARAPPCLPLLAGLLMGLGLVFSARAQEAIEPQPPPGVIRLHCEPGHVLLGEGRTAQVEVELAPEATPLEVLASEGEVGPLQRVGPGRFRATYVPPRRTLPGEVILVALARGPQGPLEAWTVLELWGQGQAEVRTRPGAPVTLRVGEASFGPVNADARGLARVPLEVPPGIHEALFGGRRVELGVPPWPYVHAVSERRELRADREETVDIRLYTSRLEQTPATPRTFSFSVTRGSVSDPVEQAPGVLRMPWTVPPGPVGDLTLRGSVARAPRWTFEVGLRAVAPPAPALEPSQTVAVQEPPRPSPPPTPSVVVLAPRLGLMTNFVDVRAPSAGLRLEVWPLRALPTLGLWLDLGVLRFTRTGGDVVPDFLGTNEWWDTTLAVGLRSPRVWSRLEGWVAAGVAVVRVHGHETWGEGRVVDESAWVLGAQAVAGAGVHLGPGVPFLEARWCWFDDPSLGVLRGSLRGAGLHVGYRLELF